MGLRLYIDPGVRACGVALFHTLGASPNGGCLVAAGYVEGSRSQDSATAGVAGAVGRPVTWTAMAAALAEWVRGRGEIDHITIEFPQVRRREHQSARKKGVDPNDIVQLAAVVGAICDRFRGIPIRAPLPEEWKGTVPKEIHNQRALERLDAEELAVLTSMKVAPSKRHNVLDAIAMGLVGAGRL